VRIITRIVSVRLLLAVVLALGASCGAVALAAPAQGVAELDVDIGYVPNFSFGQPKEFPVGTPGRFSVGPFNNGPDDATVVIVVTGPAAARFASEVSACTVAPQRLTCTAALAPNRGTDLSFAVISDRTGPLTLTASVSSDRSDPDPSDNQASVTVEILAASAGASALRAGGFTTAPKTPRAGRRFTATLAVEGSPRPEAGRVGCAAAIRGAKLRPLVRVFKAGAARCAWLVPPTAKGARLSGAVMFSAAGTTVSRKFATTVSG
jgi:hypothetical protein